MRLLVLEILFVLAALVGVALVSLPCALIIGGCLGMLACERGSSRMAKAQGRSR